MLFKFIIPGNDFRRLGHSLPAAITIGLQSLTGAQYSSAGIQLAGQTRILVATAATAPTVPNFKDYMKLELGGARELVIELDVNGGRHASCSHSGHRKAQA